MQEKLIAPQDAASLVPLADIKAQCRIDADIADDDALLRLYQLAAVTACQHELGRPILPQTWQREFEDPALQLVLHADVTAVGKVTAITVAGAEIDMAADEWRLSKGRKLVALGGWPYGTRMVRVRYTCGYWPDAAAVDAAVKSWILLRVATAYAAREAIADQRLVPLARTFVDGLLDPWRLYT